MKFKSTVIAASVLAGIMSLSAGAYAMGGASGAHVNYPTTGKIGAVMMNPYGIAPLTAVIRNGGYSLSDISVRIVPKDGGQEITYTVSDAKARTHGGIPIFGLYAGYRNTVEVSYTKTTEGKSERVEKEVYRPPLPHQQHDRGNAEHDPRGLEQPDGRRTRMEPLSAERHLRHEG